jgi:hypothetical protein
LTSGENRKDIEAPGQIRVVQQEIQVLGR